jgi:hypothetical protein
MYVRMTGGRDRGEAKEFSFVDAQDLLRTGQAVPVNFNEPDPLAKIPNFHATELKLVDAQKAGDEPAANKSPKTRRKS